MTHYRRGSAARAVAAASAVAALGLAACSSPANLAGEGKSDQLLTVSLFDEGAAAAVVRKVATAFEQKHPGWRVEVTQIPEDNYLTKLRLSVQAGDPPDVAVITRKSQAGLFQSVSDSVYKANNIDPADYNASTLETSCGYEGKLYCVGSYGGTTALFYNKDHFKSAGVDVPSATQPLTMEGYAATAAQLTHKGSDGKVIWGGYATKPTYWVDPASYLDDSGRKVELLDPEYVNTWKALVGMVRKGDSPAAGPGVASATELFASGRVSMVVADNFIIGKLKASGFEWGVAPTPVQKGQSPFVSAWTSGMGITKTAHHPKEAAQFLALFATEGQKFQAEQGLMPLNISDADKYFASLSPSNKAFADVSKLARPALWTPNPSQWQQPIQDAWNAVTSGKKSVEDALGETNPKAQKELDTQWRVWDQSKPE